MDEEEIEQVTETDNWNDYISENTKFESWTDMLEDASGEWVQTKIFE